MGDEPEPTPYEAIRDDLERIRGTLARLRREGTAAIEELATKLDAADDRGRARRPTGEPPAPPPAAS